MKIQRCAQLLSMHGRSQLECEDAIDDNLKIAGDWCSLRFAMADGASSSIFAGLWARKLVAAYCHAAENEPAWPEARFRDSAREWAREAWAKPLSWSAQEKLGRGAFATLLGMQFRRSETGQVTWSAVAMGDTCLFLIRNDALLRAFPLERSTEFDLHPFAISTDPARNNFEKALMADGDAKHGDLFLLMTDGIAQWFLRTYELGDMPWKVLDRGVVADAKGFREFIRRHQRKGRMRNDDVAMISIELCDG
jgi:hypothetical protein